MVLLTSGQVSVAISSFVVFLFTSALFLSGYVLQQKTVNDIRQAIKPQVAPLRPDLVLPPKFREGEFWDGRETVVVDVAATRPPEQQEMIEEHNRNESDDNMVGATRWQKAAKVKERERLKQEKEQANAQKVLGEAKMATKTSKKKKKNTKTSAKKIQEEEEPLSRAARRKKIKEEILLAGEGEGFKGYRRRMW